MNQKSKKRYRLIDHTADLGVEVFGRDAPALFVNAGEAMFKIILGSADRPATLEKPIAVAVVGDDWPDLMVNWLRELLYLWNGRRQRVRHIDLRHLSAYRLQAVVNACDDLSGEHFVAHEIKAVTYHGIAVGPHGDGWRARIIFDV